MKYKLEFQEENPLFVYIRLLEDPYDNMLLLLGDLQMTNILECGISKHSQITDFTYRIQENGLQVEESEIPNVTLHLSKVLCHLLNTTMESELSDKLTLS